jgi:N-acetyllactosaminide alpha-2,3-sialyltransferase
MTPLHTLIAKKIIQQQKIETYVLLYYYYEANEKITYYYEQLANDAAKSFFIKKVNSGVKAFSILVSLSRHLRGWVSPSATLYCGNIKTIYSRLPIYFLKIRKIHSFDDGIGNVCGEGYFYKGRLPSVKDNFLRVLGLDFSYSFAYGLVQKHYTIYKAPNAMAHTVYLKLFNFETGAAGAGTQPTSVLLTSTLFEDGVTTLELEQRLYAAAIRDFNVRYIIPHPLELTVKSVDTAIIKIRSQKIAEEIVVDLLKEHGQISVIGWYSSALVHLVDVPGITAINISFNNNLPLEKTLAFFESQNVRSYLPIMP